MSYIALARKWRPKTFSELIGQAHVTQTLINSIERNRLHHAYLFTGTRGVGKTSVARLLAKSMNCEKGPTGNPCLSCDSCTAIAAGEYIDLIEIDGASKTRVEDTRELLENVIYAPTHGRFKIYLIDEVHMLSQHSFNALLKTLEEPPSHVKFLLATTDPQKLPITVLSRCLQFHLRAIDEQPLTEHLQWILDQEQIKYERHALNPIVKAAQGSVRDALSLLDQCIASGNGELLLSNVNACLGYTQQDYALQLLEALAHHDIQSALTIRQHIGKEGGYYKHVLDTLLSHLHEVSVIHALSLVDPNNPLYHLSTHLLPEDAQLLYQIALKGTEDLSLAPSYAIGFEMTLIRMHLFKPAPRQAIPFVSEQKPELLSIPVALAESASKSEPKPEPEPKLETKAPILHQQEDTWSVITGKLKLQGLAHNALERTGFIDKSHGVITLRTTKSHELLFTTNAIKIIQAALSDYYQEDIKIKLQVDNISFSSPAEEREKTEQDNRENAQAALKDDVFFNQLQETFSAKIIKNSIEPVKDSL